MNDVKTIDIHGKAYVPVSERVRVAHVESKLLSITTEIIPNGGMVIVKATVTTAKGTFTGISAANPNKAIEKMSPYEVAETSAVGRALGFAGFGLVDGLATADEMVKAEEPPVIGPDGSQAFPDDKSNEQIEAEIPLGKCGKCGADNIKYKTGRVGCSKFCWKKE